MKFAYHLLEGEVYNNFITLYINLRDIELLKRDAGDKFQLESFFDGSLGEMEYERCVALT